MTKHKLTYVELRFDDGTIKTLEGKDAEQWDEDLEGMAVLAYVHGHRLQNYSWKVSQGGKSNV